MLSHSHSVTSFSYYLLACANAIWYLVTFYLWKYFLQLLRTEHISESREQPCLPSLLCRVCSFLVQIPGRPPSEAPYLRLNIFEVLCTNTSPYI